MVSEPIWYQFLDKTRIFGCFWLKIRCVLVFFVKNHIFLRISVENLEKYADRLELDDDRLWILADRLEILADRLGF